MPTCTAIASPTTVTGTLSGLTYPAYQYDEFYMRLWKYDGYSWVIEDSVYFTSAETGYSASHTFTLLELNRYYIVWAYAKWNGTWYPALPNYAPYWNSNQVYTYIPAATYYLQNATCGRLTIYRYSNTNEGYIQTYVKISGLWWSISTSGLNYSVSGDFLTIYDLEPNTTYEFDIRTYVGAFYDSEFVNYSTLSPSPPNPNVTLLSRDEGGFNLYWGSVTDATGYTLRYRTDGGYSYFDYVGNSSSIGTFQYGNIHYFSVASYRNSYYSSYTNETSIVMAPKTPYIYSYDITTSSIRIDVNNMSGTLYNDFIVEYKKSTDSSWTVISGVTMPYNITGLQLGTDYNIRAKSRVNYFSVNYESVNYSTTLNIATSARPGLFSWDYDRTQGMDYATNKIKATEWNRLTTNINAVRQFKGLSNYVFTTVYPNNTFYATLWNQAISAISVLPYTTTLPNTKTTGNAILSLDLLNIKNCINSVN
jgi:hypothetical protein